MRRFTLICSATLVLLAGCSSNEVTIRPNPKQKACLNDYALAPDWVCDTTDLATASQGSGDTLQKANTAALTHLKKSIKPYIVSQISAFYKTQNIQDTYFITHSSETVANEVIKKITIKNCDLTYSWQNPNNLTFFSLLTYPQEKLNKAIKQSVAYSVTINPSVQVQFDTQHSFDALDTAFPTSH